jgi:hypothetical protein
VSHKDRGGKLKRKRGRSSLKSKGSLSPSMSLVQDEVPSSPSNVSSGCNFSITNSAFLVATRRSWVMRWILTKNLYGEGVSNWV